MKWESIELFHVWLPLLCIFLRFLHVNACINSAFLLLLWRRKWHPTPVLLPGKSHGRRSLVGCSPQGHKESDTTEWLHFLSFLLLLSSILLFVKPFILWLIFGLYIFWLLWISLLWTFTNLFLSVYFHLSLVNISKSSNNRIAGSLGYCMFTFIKSYQTLFQSS